MSKSQEKNGLFITKKLCFILAKNTLSAPLIQLYAQPIHCKNPKKNLHDILYHAGFLTEVEVIHNKLYFPRNMSTFVGLLIEFYFAIVLDFSVLYPL
jgi:hypothetical protein